MASKKKTKAETSSDTTAAAAAKAADSKTIQKPTPCRIVEFTTQAGEDHVAVVVVHHGQGIVSVRDLTAFGEYASGVKYNAKPEPGTWRYPARCDDVLELDGDVVKDPHAEVVDMADVPGELEDKLGLAV